MTTRVVDILRAEDIHANRPAGTAVPAGALFKCSTHNLIYRSDGATWSTWATLGAGTTPFTPKVKWLSYTANNLKFTTTSWAALVTSAGASVGTALDLTLPSGSVTAGDTIEVGLGVTWQNEAIDGYLTFGTLVSSSIVNTINTSNRGISGAWGIGGAYSNASGSAFYVVQSGDLSTGALTVRPLGQGASAGTKTILAATPNAATFFVKNWGPQ